MEVFVARQPIFNIDETIIGYELLYRNKLENHFPATDSDTATIDVLVNSFLSIGIDQVSDGKPVFVNFTEKLLNSNIFDFLDSSRVIVEVLEDVSITDELIENIKKLYNRGFKIALDDFILSEQFAEKKEIFKYVHYIKVDFLSTSVVKRMEIENFVKKTYPNVRLLAEKVETRNHYDVAKHSGYVLFQGYFFEKPEILVGSDIPPNVIQYLQILALLREEEPNITLLSQSIERDISLTYKLLQLINQSNKRTKAKVRSIKQAILLLGLTELRRWIYLLALREARIDIEKDSSREVMFSSLMRAKLCEKIAIFKREKNHPEFFLVGLFSLIDAILHKPMDEILMKLPLSENILQTISGSETFMSPYLNLSIALAKGEWDESVELAEHLNIPYNTLMSFYEESISWVKESFIK